jgi:hypothetical protein
MRIYFKANIPDVIRVVNLARLCIGIDDCGAEFEYSPEFRELLTDVCLVMSSTLGRYSKRGAGP